MTARFRVVVPPITCFAEDGEIDHGATADHIKWLISNGVHTLIAGGTCGEFQMLSVPERKALMETCVAAADNKVPVWVGVMHTSTREALELAAHAEAIGADGVFSVSPYYSGPPVREVLTYFRDLANGTNLPLMVYNNPAASGVSLTVAELALLAQEGTAKAIKESHGDPARMQDLRLMVPEDTQLLYGEDYGAFQALAVGSDGWAAGVGNFMPRHAVKLWRLLDEGKLDAAREHWYRILPMVNATSKKPMFGRPDERPDFIQIFKFMLDRLGRRGGECRRPYLPLTPEDAEYIGRLADELGLTPDNA